jgi:Na+/H+ antiporter NhaD/arsenite permease-like protein
MTESFIDLAIVVWFIIGYLLIVFEPFVHIDKAGVSLLMAVGCWGLFFLNSQLSRAVDLIDLKNNFLYVSEVATFILVILVIVEIVQTHEGFNILTESLRPKSKRFFFWTIGFMTFFLSTMVANVVATIIMLALASRFLPQKEDRMIVGAGIIVASNAGGAWTPIGDVTTTMLWIANRVTTVPVIRDLFFPSIVSMIVTFIFLTFLLKGTVEPALNNEVKKEPLPYRKIIFFIGIASLILIPAIHHFLDFPPYLGALLGVGILWIATDLLYHERPSLRVPAILTRIDLSMYFFFIGILLSVQALDSAGILHRLEAWLSQSSLTPNSIAISLGLFSSVVDNVPLVAASLGMYPLTQFPTDSHFWQLIAYCAGVGGSALIIGSPAGIAYMNIEKVSFLWYAKKITIPVLIGFFAGVWVYLL